MPSTNWTLTFAAAAIMLFMLVGLEVFWRGKRSRLVDQQAVEWADTQRSIRDVLASQEHRAVIQDVRLRAVSNQAWLNQVCESTATALSASAAVITVVEIEGQRWLAYYGAEWCGGGLGLVEPLDSSYCEIVVATDQTLVVADSLRDIRLRTKDDKAKQKVRAYLGAPVRTVNGTVVGSLCVFDDKPRKWTQRDRSTVEAFSELVLL